MLIRREGLVHDIQHRARGTERMLQRAGCKARPTGKTAAEMGAHPVESRNIGALEGIDRLLLVAHDKKRPGPRVRAFPGDQFGGQRLDQLPLFGTGVLRLVHQNMASIPPSSRYNTRQRGVGEQKPRARDEVVEIKIPPRGLAGGVFRQEDGGEIMQGQGLFGGRRAFSASRASATRCMKSSKSWTRSPSPCGPWW